MRDDEPDSVSAALRAKVRGAIGEAGGWIPFDRFMALALYAPGMGYYSRAARQFGHGPRSGSDFVTAPELSPMFGRALARQVRQGLEAAGAREVVEFGAGSGALAGQLLDALGDAVSRYTIVDLSGALRERQRQHLAAHVGKVRWLEAWPDAIEGVVVGNEVLDAMPVQLLHFDGESWSERGVSLEGDRFVFAERPTPLRPPVAGFALPGAVTEIHPQAEAFVATLASHLVRGLALFIDYGFPEAEYYHPQRHGGTLMCHRAHRSDADPLADAGDKDITSHVNFTGIALAGQEAGFEVLGYTSQAHFLMNCGLLELLEGADARTLANAQKLLTEHEMGELFKVIAFGRGIEIDPIGFARGDRSHTL